MLAAAGSSGNTIALAVASIAVVGTIIAAVLPIWRERQRDEDGNNLGVLTLGQESLLASLDRANAEITQQHETVRLQVREITALRGEVNELRSEVSNALEKFNDCEDDRLALTAEVADLRRRLEAR